MPKNDMPWTAAISVTLSLQKTNLLSRHLRVKGAPFTSFNCHDQAIFPSSGRNATLAGDKVTYLLKRIHYGVFLSNG